MDDLKEIKIVDFKKEYAEDLSKIIARDLLEINIKDYSKEEMEKTAEKFTPQFMINASKHRQIYVALLDNKVIGTAGIAPSWFNRKGEYYILTVFVLPEFHRRGVGKKLIRKVEEYAKEVHAEKLIIPSSITASEFYVKLGYHYKDNLKVIDKDKHYVMEKNL